MDINDYIISYGAKPQFLAFEFERRNLAITMICGLDLAEYDGKLIIMISDLAYSFGVSNEIEKLAAELYVLVRLAGIVKNFEDIIWYHLSLLDDNEISTVHNNELDMIKLKWDGLEAHKASSQHVALKDCPFNLSEILKIKTAKGKVM